MDKWLRTIKEILDDPQPDAIDFLDTIKLNLFASEIFVFYSERRNQDHAAELHSTGLCLLLHTDIGSHCIGAKSKPKLVPLSHKLQSGDQVEFLHPNRNACNRNGKLMPLPPVPVPKSHPSCAKKRKRIRKRAKQSLQTFSRTRIYAWMTPLLDKLTRLQ